jgi:hypothetical protein
MSNVKLGAAFVSTGVIPNRIITVAVDTAYLYSQSSGQYAGSGVYMMDNNTRGGSRQEGGPELQSTVTAGTGVGFNVFPIDAQGLQGDTVQIVAVEYSNGTNVFGNFGWPKAQVTGPYQWVGTAFNQGTMTYQLKIGVSIGGAPVKYFWWDPFITCQG